METVNQPKKKDGRFYLKKKIAKLQGDIDALKRDYEQACEQGSKLAGEAYELHNKLDQAKEALGKEHALRVTAENALAREIAKSERLAENSVKANEFIGERYVWLYEHAPFWLKWWFKHTFKGAAK